MKRYLVVFGILLLPAGSSGQPRVQWRLEEVVRIGEADGPLALTRINGMTEVDGLLFISQTAEQLIRVISKDGAGVRTMGQRGDGPGEFRRIDFLGYVDGEIVAVDLAAARRTFFSPDGSSIETLRLPWPPRARPFAWLGAPYAVRNRNAIVSGSVPNEFISEYPSMPVLLANSASEVVDSVSSYDVREMVVVIGDATRSTGFRHPLHRGSRQSVSPDGSYFVEVAQDGQQVVITWLDTETLARSHRRVDLPPAVVPDAYVDAQTTRIREALEGRGWRLSRREVVEALRFPERVLAIDVVQVVQGGGVWMRERTFEDPQAVWWFVEPGQGRTLRAAAPASIRVLSQAGDTIWGSDTDDLDVDYVVGMRLVPAGG